MTENLINRITYHLSSGGLFNPELADHLAVRNLLMECREALAQPEQEPVAWMHPNGRIWTFGRGFDKSTFTIPLYTTPPQRTWVGLDSEEIRKVKHHIVEGAYQYSFKQGAEWAEAKLKEKNT